MGLPKVTQWEGKSQEYFLQEVAVLWANRKGCLTRPRCRVLVFWGQCRGAWELSRAEWSPAPAQCKADCG